MFGKILLDSLTRRWKRKAVAVLSVWIGISLVVGFLVLATNVGDKMNLEFHSLGANIKVEPLAASVPLQIGDYQLAPTAAPAYLQANPVTKLKKFFWRNNILGISPQLWSDGFLGSEKVRMLGVWFDHRIFLGKGEIFVTGARQVYGHWRVDGNWPASGDQRSCLVGKDLAGKLHFFQGSRVEVREGRRKISLVVSGIVSTGSVEDSAVIAPLEAIQNFASLQNKISDIDITALTTPESLLTEKYHKDPKSLTPEEMEQWSCTPFAGTIAAAIQNVIPGSAALVVRRVAETQGKVLTRIQGLMAALALLCLAACSLSVMGVLAAAILERQSEVSLLQAIGAHRRDVLALFLTEGAIIGGAGGILAAFTGSWIGYDLIRRIFESEPTLKLVPLLISPVLGILIAWIGSFFPVRHALGREVALVLHEE